MAEINAHLLHDRLDLGMDARARLCSCGDGYRLLRVRNLIEEGRRHLGTPGIVNTRENDSEHEVSCYFFPTLSSSLLRAIESRVTSGINSVGIRFSGA